MQLENLQANYVVLMLVNQHREQRTVITPGDAVALGVIRMSRMLCRVRSMSVIASPISGSY